MKILWLKTELLHPVDKGGKIRTYNMLKELKREHHVTYLSLDDGAADQDGRDRAAEYCQELICVPHKQRAKFTAGFYAELSANLISPLPYAIKKYVSRDLMNQIQRRASNFDVVVCDFLAPAANVPAGVSTPAVLFQHNVEAMIWERHYEIEKNPLKKLYLYDQWRKMREFERAMCSRFDAIIAVSTEDKQQMQAEYAAKNVFDVPTGVDTEFFRPSHRETVAPHNLVFTGSMDWLPNEDGIHYFTEQIMPVIKAALPDVTLTVVGRNPYSSLRELAQRDSSIIVTGRVDDVRPHMERAAIYVVPLRVAGGTRLKIYEAMAMEKPIVSTSIGAEGLPVRDGKEILLADTPETFAKAVIDLFQNKEAADELGKRAAKFVREEFGWQKVAQRFAEICEGVIKIKPARTSIEPGRSSISRTQVRVEQVQEI